MALLPSDHLSNQGNRLGSYFITLEDVSGFWKAFHYPIIVAPIGNGLQFRVPASPYVRPSRILGLHLGPWMSGCLAHT